MKFTKVIKKFFVKKNNKEYAPFKKLLAEEDKIIEWNIYEAKTVHECVNTMKFVFCTFKRKLVVPGLWLIDKLILKKWYKEPSKESYNTNLNIFSKAIEDSLHEWTWAFLYPINNKNKDHFRKFEESGDGPYITRVIKKIILFVVKNDTAYRELMNIIMHNIARGMIKEYSDKKEVKHLFYSNKNVYDVNYLHMSNLIHEDKKKEFVKEEKWKK